MIPGQSAAGLPFLVAPEIKIIKDRAMKKSSLSFLTIFSIFSIAAALGSAVYGQNQFLFSPGYESVTAAFTRLSNIIVGNWQQYGELFTRWQPALFKPVFFWTIVSLPAVFLLHFVAVGPRVFDHGKGKVFFFGAFTRFVHWVAAISFTLLVLTGLAVIFGKVFGGGSLIMNTRHIHLISALIFAMAAPWMFLIWLKDMFPMPYDLKWFFIMGGYLSKGKKPVPAGKFNAGQKIWFWLATVGGGVMAWTGYQMFAFGEPVDSLRLAAIIHNLLGAALTGFFIIHLYMSLFAIKGSLQSMISGYKPREEVEILHSRYKIQ